MYLLQHVPVYWGFCQRDGFLMKAAPTFILPVRDEATIDTFVGTPGSQTIKFSRCAVCIYVPVVIL